MDTLENISVTQLEDLTQLKICITAQGQVFSFEITRDMGYLFLYELYNAVDLYGGHMQKRATN